MKISMHILEQWLRKEGLEVKAAIPDGQTELQTVRITEQMDLSGVASISVQDAQKGLIRISNRTDRIWVSNSAAEDVFNKVLAAFEYYNAWENALLRSVFEGASLQELLDIAHLALMRPMLIQNSRYEIVAITDSYGSINAIWETYHKAGGRKEGKPFRLWFFRERFNAMTERASLQEPVILSSRTNREDFILANLFLQKTRVGHITIYEQQRPFYPGDLQLMKAFQEIVSLYVSSNPHVLFERSVLDAWLNEKLDGNSVPGERVSLRSVYRYTGWSETDAFAVTHFSMKPHAGRKEYDWLQNELDLAFIDAYPVFTGDGVVVLFHFKDTREYDAVTEKLASINFEEVCGWGVSQLFCGLQELEKYGRIAKEVAGEAMRRGIPGTTLGDSGLSILMQNEGFAEELERLAHPEYEKLRDYDAENHTQLAETLFWYIHFNGNYSDTAARMDTHRSTTHYRMAKIFELINPRQMESVESRILYQLSYLREQRK